MTARVNERIKRLNAVAETLYDRWLAMVKQEIK
jgi:hypothetical protein